MSKEELVEALRRHYRLPEYMLDADVIQSCEGLPGWYWIKARHWFGKNRGKAGTVLLTIAVAALWLLIAHLSLEELAR